MGKNKHGKQSKKKQVKKQVKLENPIVEKRVIKSNSEDTIVNQDSKGNLVLTPEDKVKLDKAKTLQSKAKQAMIDAKQAKLDAIEAIQALDGSDAIKAIKQDIEGRLAKQEKVVTELTEKRDSEIDKLRSIQSELQSLTGIDKKVKASKAKGKTGNNNGKFETKPIKVDSDGSLLILVTHKATDSLFQYSLYPDNGKINHTDWIKLRHSLTAHFEKATSETDLTIRAYLSNLKGKIDAVKTIADKV